MLPILLVVSPELAPLIGWICFLKLRPLGVRPSELHFWRNKWWCLQQLVPSAVQRAWERWNKEPPMLGQHIIPRCYFLTSIDTFSTQLHEFCDASKLAYGGVVYLRVLDSDDNIRIALVMAKTKVAPVKKSRHAAIRAMWCSNSS